MKRVLLAAFWLLVGMTIANVFFVVFGDVSWERVLERIIFQGVAMAALLFMLRRQLKLGALLMDYHDRKEDILEAVRRAIEKKKP